MTYRANIDQQYQDLRSSFFFFFFLKKETETNGTNFNQAISIPPKALKRAPYVEHAHRSRQHVCSMVIFQVPKDETISHYFSPIISKFH
jgi:hypothetical protein